MEFDYIIIQAGGKGTRLGYLTQNKPKALVPIQNLPMIFHLFEKYPNKKFIIIGDYKIDVLKKYLSIFSKVKYIVVDAKGNQGTCSGIKDSINLIPNKQPFMIIWSDLILPQDFQIDLEDKNYIGLSKDFKCRWRYENNELEEISSIETGVAGLFIFNEKSIIADVPQSGEFVRWLKDKKLDFDIIELYNTMEYGLLEDYVKMKSQRCRPFNRLVMKDTIIIKEGIDEQGKRLEIIEKGWYKEVNMRGFDKIPKIHNYEPFTMEKIEGKNIFEYDFNYEEKKNILEKIIMCLKELHCIGEKKEVDYFSIHEAYVSKTLKRLSKIRDLVPFSDKKIININGKDCRNVFFYADKLEEKFSAYSPKYFEFLHGDCTFSNMMLKDDKNPILIDPRGYFGFTELYGDPLYDWAKLYYSIKGNYDQFNLKRFKLNIEKDKVNLEINSNDWEDMEKDFFNILGNDMENDIKLIHSIIWLSLTTYAWEDYDSICGAFYNGLYYLEDIL